jgi:hypothetical protein
MQQTLRAANMYRIETLRRGVTLSMIGGEELRGSVFIHSSSHRPFELEDLSELFNSTEEFFPFELETGEVILVSKSRIAEIAGAGAVDACDQPNPGPRAPTALLQVLLIGGEVRVGSICLEARPDRARVLDYLNRFNARFLTLYTSNEARLINRSLIDRVRPLD